MYAGWWQARAALDRRSAQEFRSGHAVPIVIIPGVYETWRFMQPLVAALHSRGHPVHVLESLAHNRRPVVDAARTVTEFLEGEGITDALIVAHSKGGLAGKAVLTGPAGDRIRGMVAIAAPFGGSRYARLLPVRTLRAFAPNDPEIMGLSTHLDVNSRIVSIFAEFDPHIPEGSELRGALKNVRLDTGGHFRILAHPRVMAEIAAFSER